MIFNRRCSMAKPESRSEQMEVQLGGLAMRVVHELEGAAPWDTTR
jgi:hypothetical protein